jgi:anti-anti-sigma factor
MRLETAGDVLVVVLEGRLDSSNSKEVEQELMQAIEGRHAVVIDFAGLSYISSAGLRVILLVGKRMRAARGRLALCSLPSTIREVFEISGFLSIFDVHDGRDEAVSAVAEPAS